MPYQTFRNTARNHRRPDSSFSQASDWKQLVPYKTSLRMSDSKLPSLAGDVKLVRLQMGSRLRDSAEQALSAFERGGSASAIIVERRLKTDRSTFVASLTVAAKACLEPILPIAALSTKLQKAPKADLSGSTAGPLARSSFGYLNGRFR